MGPLAGRHSPPAFLHWHARSHAEAAHASSARQTASSRARLMVACTLRRAAGLLWCVLKQRMPRGHMADGAAWRFLWRREGRTSAARAPRRRSRRGAAGAVSPGQLLCAYAGTVHLESFLQPWRTHLRRASQRDGPMRWARTSCLRRPSPRRNAAAIPSGQQHRLLLRLLLRQHRPQRVPVRVSVHASSSS